ncbi:MAG: glycosyltransferase family 4 protein, partial [Phycisphaeraceae bacterium]
AQRDLLVVMRGTDAAVHKHLAPLAMLEEVRSITVVRPEAYAGHRLEKTVCVPVPAPAAAGNPIRRAWVAYRAAARHAAEQKVDAVLSFNPLPYGWIAHRVAKRHGLPCHVGFVGTDWWKWASRRPALRRWLGRIDALTCTGSTMKRDMVAHGLDPAKIRVLPHGIDVDRLDHAPKLEAAYDAVFVGRLAAVKRVDLILDAFVRVVHHRSDAKLAIVGDGPEAKPLRERVNALGLEPHVHFAGWVEDVTPWLQASKLVLLASLSEGMPFSLIEGMCCGCVPITTDVGDIGDHVRHEENGLLVPADAEAMAEAILELLNQPQRLRRMSERAMRMRESFGYDAASNAWRELLAGPLRDATFAR